MMDSQEPEPISDKPISHSRIPESAVRLNGVPALYYRGYALVVATGAVFLSLVVTPIPLRWALVAWGAVAAIALLVARAVRSFFDVYVSELGVCARGRGYRRVTIAWSEPQRVSLKRGIGLAYLEIESLETSHCIQVGIGWGARVQLAEIARSADLPPETRASYLQLLS
jgi:hypothetical protein